MRTLHFAPSKNIFHAVNVRWLTHQAFRIGDDFSRALVQITPGGFESLRENSILEGHGFSRAALTSVLEGFSP
jgi:hypothetical protein